MSPKKDNDDGMTPMLERSIWLHELRDSLVKAGFEEEEAFELIKERLPFFPGDDEKDTDTN